MAKRITLVVLPGLLVIVVVAGFLRFLSPQPSNNEHPIGSGVMVSSNNLPGNLNAVVIKAQTPVDPKLATVVSSTFQIGPSGKLSSPMTIQIPLTRLVPAGSKLVVMTSESPNGPWTPLANQLSQDAKSVTVTVTHLSLFEVLWLDLQAMAAEFKRDFVDGLTSNLFVKAEPPTCQNRSIAYSDDYSVTSSNGDTIFWCFGMVNGKRELTAVNNRSYVLAAQHPGLPVVNDSEATGGWGQIAQLVSSTYHEALIFPAEATQFGANLSSGKQGGIKTQADPVSQLLYSLETGVDSMLAIVTHFGASKETGDKVLDVTNTILGKAECLDAVATYLNSNVKGKSGDFGGVMTSCLTPADVLDSLGVWGVILAPVMAFSGIIAYFRSSVEGIADIILQRDQYHVVISRGLPSPCPASAGICLGIRSGDVDGDGKPDEVGLTYEAGSTQVVVHVVFATGATAEGVFDISNYVGGNPGWLGLSDINGDGRDEIFMQVSPGEVQLAEVLQYYNGSLQKVRGNMPSTLVIGLGGTSNIAGMGCRVVGGSSQLITFSGAPVGNNFNPTNSSPVSGTQTVYQADVSGAMLKVSQQTVTTTYGQVEAMFGHCSGLSYP